MRIAIVGAGMAGLSLAFHLSHLGFEATVFDSKGIGGGASGVSTGLLHPFPGKSALRSWRSSEGMAASLELLNAAEKALGKPVFEKTGLFRPAVTEEQKRDFFFRSTQDPDAIWQENPLFGWGLWIPQGITVYSKTYLEGLWKASKNALFSSEKISSLKQLDNYDRIILCAGHEITQFEECKNLPLKATKGQSLICRWPKKLPHALDSLGHISPTEDPFLCQIGSTYERIFEHGGPDPEKALELKERASLFYPPARDFEIVEIKAGIRISPINGYQPLTLQINPKTTVFTGLGSKGLLYHALLGKELALSCAV